MEVRNVITTFLFELEIKCVDHSHNSVFGDGQEGMYSIADIISRVHCAGLHAHVEGKLEKTQQNIR